MKNYFFVTQVTDITYFKNHPCPLSPPLPPDLVITNPCVDSVHIPCVDSVHIKVILSLLCEIINNFLSTLPLEITFSNFYSKIVYTSPKVYL